MGHWENLILIGYTNLQSALRYDLSHHFDFNADPGVPQDDNASRSA